MYTSQEHRSRVCTHSIRIYVTHTHTVGDIGHTDRRSIKICHTYTQIQAVISVKENKADEGMDNHKGCYFIQNYQEKTLLK